MRILVLAALLPLAGVYGQADPSVNSQWIRELWIQTGIHNQYVTSSTVEDFRSLAPSSAFLGRDLGEFRNGGNVGPEPNSFFAFSASHPLSELQNSKGRTFLRVGFVYSAGTILSGNVYREDVSPWDTLTSAQNGQYYYMDSVTTESYLMEYGMESVRLDASFIIRTNPELRWSVFAGIGVSAGVSFNARTEILYSLTEETEIRGGGSDPVPFGNTTDDYYEEAEYFRNKSGVCGSLYVPFGIDFRLGKMSEFWKRAHLFYEFRPGINVSDIPEWGTYASGIFQVGFGARIILD